jgi:hypothetical protein
VRRRGEKEEGRDKMRRRRKERRRRGKKRRKGMSEKDKMMRRRKGEEEELEKWGIFTCYLQSILCFKFILLGRIYLVSLTRSAFI